MTNATFALVDVTRVLRSFRAYGPRFMVRAGRFNGVCMWLSGDEYFHRALHANLLNQVRNSIKQA